MQAASDRREFGTWLERHLELFVPGMRVVELGCGIGSDARYLSGLGLNVIGLDLSRSRVATAAGNALDARFVVADLTEGLPFRSDVFDLVVASLSLHYFDWPTTGAIVDDIARILVANGTLLCRVNVVGDRRSLWGVGIEHEPDYFEVRPGHFKRFFTVQTLAKTLHCCFEVESIFQEQTRVYDGTIKETLVARARRSH